jgi:hypothetical protein
MQSILDTEHGGMNEIFADAYQMTGNEKYLTAAKRFSHKMLLDAMAIGNDNLDNKHANTQVPKAVGFQRIGELSHDDKYEKAAVSFGKQLPPIVHLRSAGIVDENFSPQHRHAQILLMMWKVLSRVIHITCLS